MTEKEINGFVGNGLTLEGAVEVQRRLNEKKNRPWVI